MSLDNILLIPGVGGAKGLLDLYPGSAAAYSLRKLRTAYAGSCIRVRRDSDNAEQDIGFVGGLLDTTSLLSFVGAGDGFVTTWHDQTINGRDLANTTLTKQPRVVSSGSLITEGGLPSIEADGSNDSLFVTGVSFAQPYSYFHVRRYRSNGAQCSLSNSSTSGGGYVDINIFNQFRSFYGAYLGTFPQNTNRGIFYSLGNGASSEVSLNGSAIISGNAGSSQSLEIHFGAAVDNFFAPVNTQEILFYSSNQSVNRLAIVANQNDFWGVY